MTKKKSDEYLSVAYKEAYPDDSYWQEIDPDATFMGLLGAMIENKDVYRYIGVEDSVIRERLFGILSKILNVDYDRIHGLWLYGVTSN